MRVARYIAGLVAAIGILAFAAPAASASDPPSPYADAPFPFPLVEWQYAQAMKRVRARVSNPDRWRFGFVAYMSRTLIVEGTKLRTGTRRYFMVTQHPRGRLRVNRYAGPLGCVLLAAVAMDAAHFGVVFDPEPTGAVCGR